MRLCLRLFNAKGPRINISQILSDLADVPEERASVALADAVFYLEETDVRSEQRSRRFEFCVAEADVIRRRLKAHGFEIVHIAVSPLTSKLHDFNSQNNGMAAVFRIPLPERW